MAHSATLCIIAFILSEVRRLPHNNHCSLSLWEQTAVPRWPRAWLYGRLGDRSLVTLGAWAFFLLIQSVSSTSEGMLRHLSLKFGTITAEWHQNYCECSLYWCMSHGTSPALCCGMAAASQSQGECLCGVVTRYDRRRI